MNLADADGLNPVSKSREAASNPPLPSRGRAKASPLDDPDFIQSFSEWLDSREDSLPEPESFSDWLKQNDDAILERPETSRPAGSSD
jgi:hypothetical protein